LWLRFIFLSWICDPALSGRWASGLRKKLWYVNHVLNFVAGWWRAICLRFLSFLFCSTNNTKYAIINVTSNGDLVTAVGTRSLFSCLLIYKHSSFKICLQNYLLNPVPINVPNVSMACCCIKTLTSVILRTLAHRQFISNYECFFLNRSLHFPINY
jgi:hypothetical protein